MKIALLATAVTAVLATPAFAANTYQNSCSNIGFAYSGNDAALTAVCLRADGTPNATKLILQGISNQTGKLTQGSGPSTFQKSCGNIQIITGNSPNTTLSALCRTSSGSSIATSLSLNNIANNSGNLVQQ